MYHHMYGGPDSGWDWLWMTFMMLGWLALLGGVVYGAVRLAVSHQHVDPDRRRRPREQ